MRHLLAALLLTACSDPVEVEPGHTGEPVDTAEPWDTGEEPIDTGDGCAQEEVPYNGIDDDCDESTPDDDLDGDGFFALREDGAKGIDCDDGDPEAYPNASEVYGDEIDQDCDGEVDEGCGTQRGDLDLIADSPVEVPAGVTAVVAEIHGAGGVCGVWVEDSDVVADAWLAPWPACTQPADRALSAEEGAPVYVCVVMGDAPSTAYSAIHIEGEGGLDDRVYLIVD
jgi:hypothetical protein